ncbi:twin-arginine translocase TatA/TatE family subunit [Sulfuracidifex tepidarius]|nr:twin-arginine translocase TatA/TatE family subunit [Sulfuracidifex tepidarius]
MLGNLDDMLVVVIVGILLLGGLKNPHKVAKDVGKTINEMKNVQRQFSDELKREIDESLQDDPQPSSVEELEKKIRELQNELERLKNGDNKA